jgi:hypothetical protein
MRTILIDNPEPSLAVAKHDKILAQQTDLERLSVGLGDFLALATGAAQVHTRITGPKREHKEFVAHHAGLTREEMLVPLIRVDT